jgi:molybdopterin/thiamine biosynthesis adenylyltransferase
MSDIKDFTRYIRNTNSFSREEVELVRKKSVCVAGCGGLGGYVAMSLARFGIGRLGLIDGDVFEPSTLNRQLFCTEAHLGKSKAMEAKLAIESINSETLTEAYIERLTEENGDSLLRGFDAVVDCLDNTESRLILENCCEALDIPFIHGAIGGFYGQVSCVFPGDRAMSALYAGSRGRSGMDEAGNPPFTPQLVAAIQCSETLKLLTGKGETLRKKLLLIDLLRNTMQTIDFA